jgi:sialic acid synthase SpsE
MNFFAIGKKTFSPQEPLIIAEIGTGHNGNLARAKELIDAASYAGASCAKFQHVYADEIIHPKTGFVPLPGGKIALYDRFKAAEFPIDFFEELKAYTEQKELIFLCTPFGLRSASELQKIQVEAIKIASPELNHIRLLEEVASYHLPTILSTGVSKITDIERALDCFSNTTAIDSVALLHCVTAYPAPEADYNLHILQTLTHVFGVPCGVSDHSLDSIFVPMLSISVGACIIEKHICLSRKDPGLDDPIALPPDEFRRMTREVYHASNMTSDAIVAEMIIRYGRDLVDATLGDGIKRFAPSERENYERTNRSLHARHAIQAGEVFTAENVVELRTEKILRPGLHPALYDVVIGRKANKNIPDGEGIRWEDVGGF